MPLFCGDPQEPAPRLPYRLPHLRYLAPVRPEQGIRSRKMPELPEVETVRRGLEARIQGLRFREVEARRGDLRWPLPQGFAAALAGRRVVALRRRGKYLLIDLDGGPADDGGRVLLVHLGMSGRIVIGGQENELPRHEHVVFVLEDGVRVRFRDHRRFGAMDLFAPAAEPAHWLLAGLGPEPLDPGFTAQVLRDRLAGRRSPLKAALLDQKLVAGLGNIYVCEALFRARLSPRRIAATVGPVRAGRLAAAIRQVLEEAIAAGGSSLRDYVDASGELGYFQTRFRVYDRAGMPCPECATPVNRIVQSARSSYFCPACQR